MDAIRAFLDVLPPQMRDPVLFAIPFFLLLLIIEWTAARKLEHLDPAGRPAVGRVYEARCVGEHLDGPGVGRHHRGMEVRSRLLGYAAIYAYLAPWHLPATQWYTWVIAILGVDLLFYTYHRIAHRVRLIWATHQAHHSSQYFNFATALRQKWNNSGEILIWIPLPLLGIPPWMVFASFSINLIYQFWVHTERIDKLWRPIEFIFNTPSHHRVHHGMDAEYLDKNYARHPDHLGPHVRHLPARDVPSALRADQTGQHLQHLEAADPRIRGHRPRCSPGDAPGATGSATYSARPAGSPVRRVQPDIPAPIIAAK